MISFIASKPCEKVDNLNRHDLLPVCHVVSLKMKVDVAKFGVLIHLLHLDKHRFAAINTHFSFYVYFKTYDLQNDSSYMMFLCNKICLILSTPYFIKNVKNYLTEQLEKL